MKASSRACPQARARLSPLTDMGGRTDIAGNQTRRPWLAAALTVVMAPALASCSAAGPRAPEDPADAMLSNAGPTNAAPSNIGPRVVSLNPCLDAILVDVAAREQILALSHYSRDEGSSSIDPALAASFAYTGGTAEEVIALDPDIVLASTFIAPATRSALERAGLRVETFGSPVSVAESLDQVGKVAAMLGRADEGDALAHKITQSVPDRQSLPEKGAVSMMLWQPGQIVPGQASLVWDILSRYGTLNHNAALGLDQADHASLEMIVANPPDVLLIAGDHPGQLHPLLQGLDTTFVARFEPKLFYCGGPSIIAAADRMDEVRADFMMNPSGAHVHDAR